MENKLGVESSLICVSTSSCFQALCLLFSLTFSKAACAWAFSHNHIQCHFNNGKLNTANNALNIKITQAPGIIKCHDSAFYRACKYKVFKQLLLMDLKSSLALQISVHTKGSVMNRGSQIFLNFLLIEQCNLLGNHLSTPLPNRPSVNLLREFYAQLQVLCK